MINPFELVTASKLSAEEAIRLWCDDRRLARVNGKENCFINGHRGTGKSMLFRVLQYDCQRLLNPTDEPDFVSVYFSVRDSELMTQELDFFQQDSQKYILSESHLSLLILKQLFLVLHNHPNIIPPQLREGFLVCIRQRVSSAFRFSQSSAPTLEGDFEAVLNQMIDLLEDEWQRIVHYVGLLVYERISFDGPLFLFDTLLYPLADFLHQKTGKTLYVLIDDGDDLPESHTVVLNTWIARRNVAVVFKVSTMFGYKTYRTRTRSAIQHPHDFTQYEIATRYLSDDSEHYIELLNAITQRRLASVNINVSSEQFFPEDETQKEALAVLSDTLTAEYQATHPGRSARDYVYRHLTSEYIKRILIPGRSMGTFIYSGFKVLATLSSGMVRDYIICSQKMFDNAARLPENASTVPQHIPPQIQTRVVRQHADDVLDEIGNPTQKRYDASAEEWRDVRRLVEGLGQSFRTKMQSEDAERRVFSFAFQDEPSPYIERLLYLAISEGYLMKGYISRKEGTGRRVLYVLTRRLAPAFTLDVSSYAGYLSVTNDRIKRLVEHGLSRSTAAAPDQLDLFKEFEYLNSTPTDLDVERENWVFISPTEAGL